MSSYYTNLDLAKRGNEALSINAPTGADFHITTNGSDWLWAAFCCFATYALVMHIFMFKQPLRQRYFFYTAVVPAWIMTVAYFTWASDLGWAPVRAEFNHVTVDDQETTPGYRQVFYLKSINWFLCFPFHTLTLGLFANLPRPQISYNMFLTGLFVIAFLAGSVVHSTYKWGYFTVGVVAIFLTLINLWCSRKNALTIGKDCGYIYTLYLACFGFMWLIYPIAWALSEGGNVIQPDSEAVFCGVLDIITFIIIPGAFFFFTHDFDLKRINLGEKPDIEAIINKELSNSSLRASGETAFGSQAISTPPAEAAETA